jgi:hypothetical protein
LYSSWVLAVLINDKWTGIQQIADELVDVGLMLVVYSGILTDLGGGIKKSVLS